jgi:hypothetical protein
MTQPGPNPQTNLIFSIVAPVVALIAVAVIYFTKPIPAAIAPPTAVNVAPAKLPADSVVVANALPGAASSTGGPGSGGPAGGPPGGMPGRAGGSGKKAAFQGASLGGG